MKDQQQNFEDLLFCLYSDKKEQPPIVEDKGSTIRDKKMENTPLKQPPVLPPTSSHVNKFTNFGPNQNTIHQFLIWHQILSMPSDKWRFRLFQFEINLILLGQGMLIWMIVLGLHKN